MPLEVINEWRDVVERCLLFHPGEKVLGTNVLQAHATLSYFFYALRSGVYVRIQEGVLRTVCPFVNLRFTNTWAHRLQGTAPLVEAARRPRKDAAPGRRHVALNRIWANGNILCTQEQDNGQRRRGHGAGRKLLRTGNTFENAAQLESLLAMVVKAAAAGCVPDMEFMINIRDAPCVHMDKGRHPYLHLPRAEAGSQVARYRCRTAKLIPVLSVYGGPQWSDAPLPPPCDVVSAFRHFTRHPPTGTPWADRAPVALFRGTATGQGVSVKTNTRLALRAMAERHGVLAGVRLDIGITKLNRRWRVLPGGSVAKQHPANAGCRVGAAFVPMEDQVHCRYLLYVDGHSGASRLVSLLHLGAVVLRVAPRSDVACHLWTDMLPQPVAGAYIGVDGQAAEAGTWVVPAKTHATANAVAVNKACYLWVDEDMRNLEATLAWAEAHMDIAAAIADRGRAVACQCLTLGHMAGFVADVLVACRQKACLLLE